MKILLSPAKTLDYTSTFPKSFEKLEGEMKMPPFLKASKELIEILKKYKQLDLQNLMGISEKLAVLNQERYRDWNLEFELSEEVRPAIYAFRGDVYDGINVDSLSVAEIKRMEKSVVVLSGLYGALTPLTLMRPYRLEMGTKLSTPKGKDLYQFWGDRVADWINQESGKNDFVVNLASNEYYKVVKDKLKQNIISPVFKDLVKGEYKIVSFWAKKARGLMTRFLIQNQLNQVDGIKKFNLDGYQYQAKLSTENEPVFYRKH